ncbi:MAG TPA: hypothetical protein RMG48_15975 [Myxococcales bacterium LLY-WYZ-16_1]|jgi:hypothetical protein|nr:hypothetical protein [Myxococcales bacterium LLY-WYZ-16_1]
MGRIFIALSTMLAMACGPGGDTNNDCTGGFSGVLLEESGEEAGYFSAFLTFADPGETSELRSGFFFLEESDEIPSTMTVSDDGQIMPQSGRVQLTGVLETDDCTASGQWTALGRSGTFTAEKQ